mmetsp:Transcript_536/g.1184  ORF Transcript_536/g.1184 Transcript_536/m.1184 type:complete len:81 (-) Transcript_536:56-298(-)
MHNPGRKFPQEESDQLQHRLSKESTESASAAFISSREWTLKQMNDHDDYDGTCKEFETENSTKSSFVHVFRTKTFVLFDV